MSEEKMAEGQFGKVNVPTVSEDERLDYQKRVHESLERIWKAYSPRMNTLNYELVVLAIPRFPSNIEAVCRGMDVETLVEVLEAFLVQFKEAQGVADPVDGG